MGLGPAAVKLYLELWQRGIFTDLKSAIDMGSQELHLNMETFDSLTKSAGIQDYDESQFSNLKHYPNRPRVEAKPFYELLGFTDYRCVDLNELYGAVSHDLNLVFEQRDLFGKFDLVADHGNNEHVFNVVESYKTMHRLCKKNGIIIINQNMYGGNGYFNFDISFYESMAAANQYRILFSSYIVHVHKKYFNAEHHRLAREGSFNLEGTDQIHIPISNELLDIINWSKDRAELGICYVFQKLSDDDFEYAYQGDFISQLKDNYGYQLQFAVPPPGRTYLPIRANDSNKMADGVLSSIPFSKLVRHMLKRLSRRLF